MAISQSVWLFLSLARVRVLAVSFCKYSDNDSTSLSLILSWLAPLYFDRFHLKSTHPILAVFEPRVQLAEHVSCPPILTKNFSVKSFDCSQLSSIRLVTALTAPGNRKGQDGLMWGSWHSPPQSHYNILYGNLNLCLSFISREVDFCYSHW